MFYADTVGLPGVLQAMETYGRGRHGEAWAPAPLMVRLAIEGRGFND
jgi:3-hydroxyacyl-CoA dehydrogenase